MHKLSLNRTARTARTFSTGLKDSVQTYRAGIVSVSVFPHDPSYVLSDGVGVSRV